MKGDACATRQAAILDAEEMRDKLQVGEERFFRFGLYLYGVRTRSDELDIVSHNVEQLLGQQLIYPSPPQASKSRALIALCRS